MVLSSGHISNCREGRLAVCTCHPGRWRCCAQGQCGLAAENTSPMLLCCTPAPSSAMPETVTITQGLKDCICRWRCAELRQVMAAGQQCVSRTQSFTR